jgi:hypothetical protein
MFGEAAMAEPWDVVAEAAMAEPTRHKRGLLGGCDAHASSETSVVRCKLGETIEQSCSDFLEHTLEVYKSAHWYNEYSATQG